MRDKDKPSGRKPHMDYQGIVERLTEILDSFFTKHSTLFEKVGDAAVECLRTGHKILIFGNGGSASQAQHFAAELVNKFMKERAPYRAISLTTDTSALTSIANDVSFEQVFSRQLEALGDKGDMAVALSTSGNSPNVIEALKKAKEKEMATVAFAGKTGGNLARLPDYLLTVPSASTPRIQEVHLVLLHLLAKKIEDRLGS